MRSNTSFIKASPAHCFCGSPPPRPFISGVACDSPVLRPPSCPPCGDPRRRATITGEANKCTPRPDGLRDPMRGKERRRFTVALTSLVALAAIGCGSTDTGASSTDTTAPTPPAPVVHHHKRRHHPPAPAITTTPTATTTQAQPPPSPTEDVGSSSHAGDAQFCSAHQCIGDFTGEGGTIVRCADNTYSHAGGISGSCSHHGGEG